MCLRIAIHLQRRCLRIEFSWQIVKIRARLDKVLDLLASSLLLQAQSLAHNCFVIFLVGPPSSLIGYDEISYGVVADIRDQIELLEGQAVDPVLVDDVDPLSVGGLPVDIVVVSPPSWCNFSCFHT